MCGIAGFLSEHVSPDDEAVLRRMVATLHHRGPDQTGIYIGARAALGHTRLSIIDLSGGRQPMCNEDGSLWIVFNGEIYNYVELRRKLVARGHTFSTHSDTEVILHLFEDYGEDSVTRLNGQWAFAIWDARRSRLFLSRDRLGVRPLFYARVGSAFLFASEMKALLEYPGIQRELDLKALKEIFTFWHTIPPRTTISGVKQLPPAHSATVRGENLQIKRYWDLDYSHDRLLDTRTGASEADLADELLGILQSATRLRLRSDVPVAAYLSGGLDSAFVSALAIRSGVENLKTFSLRFQSTELDEGAYQEAAARHLQTGHSPLLCGSADIRAVFPAVIRHTESPILRTAPAPLYLLARLVRSSGYKVVLTGEGSDELLGGYDIYKETKIREFWAKEPASRLRPLLLKKLYPYMPRLQSQPPAYLQAFFKVNGCDVRDPFFSHLPRWRLTAKLLNFLSPEVSAATAQHNPIEAMEALLPASFSGWDAFSRAQYLETCFLLPGYILSSQGDRVAMAHSVEGRFPFLDHRLAEFSALLPSHMKMKVLNEKYLLKCCGRPFVPPAVLSRPKQPYRAPDAHSFFDGPPDDYAGDLLSAGQIRCDGIFHWPAVQKLAEKGRAGSISGVADNMAAIGVLSTELFLREFIFSCPSEGERLVSNDEPMRAMLHRT